jgi:hypothetical protein
MSAVTRILDQVQRENWICVFSCDACRTLSA